MSRSFKLIMIGFFVCFMCSNFVCAGTITAWGSNYHGEMNVPSGNDFIAFDSGEGHCLALKEDGSLVAWGGIGYDNVTDVPAGNDYVAVAAGGDFNIGLRSNGSLAVTCINPNSWILTDMPTGNDIGSISTGLVPHFISFTTMLPSYLPPRAYRCTSNYTPWPDTYCSM